MADKLPVTVFVGSSTEHKELADHVQLLLASRDIRIVPWHVSFRPGSFTLESLEDQLSRVDFAALILAADDVTISRDVQSPAARDNVLFELGLFMGCLGRKRAFYLFDESAPVKLPSDLSGVTGIGQTRSGLDKGDGSYFTINLTKLDATSKRSFRMQRCSPDEIDAMESDDQGRIRKCVIDRLAAV